MNQILRFGLVFSVLLGLAGCATDVGHFSRMSTAPVDFPPSAKPAPKQHVRGESCLYNVFIIPLGTLDGREQEAFDDAVRVGKDRGLPGDTLVNVDVKFSTLDVMVGGRRCFSVEGDLVESRLLPAAKAY